MDKRRIRLMKSSITILILLFSINTASAQTTAFIYQGRLTDGGNPANGSFQMQFKLFDSLGGPGQVGPTITDVPVTVNQGLFSVRLDFGANVFTGADRWLEIAVRHNAGEVYTTLSPREQIASSPYAVRTLSAALADDSQKLGGVNANQFVQTNDARLTDARNPLPNSPNYIQNTSTQQAASNFNISGNGTVGGSLNANGAFTAGGIAAPASAPAGQGRIYFDSATNKFRISENGGGFVDLVGAGGVSGIGTTNTIPLWSGNTTLGNSAITQSGNNIGIGSTATPGRLNIVGNTASNLGQTNIYAANGGQASIGMFNDTGTSGWLIGRDLLGGVNSFFIYDRANSTFRLAIDNSGNVGIGTTSPQSKLTVQTSSSPYGLTHTDGTVTLASAVVASGTVFDGGYFGTRSNHSLHFFVNDGLPNMTIGTNGNVGIGTASPQSKLEVNSGAGGNGHILIGAPGCEAGYGGIGFASTLANCTNYSLIGNGTHTLVSRPSGGGLFFREANTDQMMIASGGNVGIGTTTPNAKLQVVGNVTQDLNSRGFVKAMVFVLANGTIARCYNGVTGATTNNCGFSVSFSQPNAYFVDFGFDVSSRFYSLTSSSIGLPSGISPIIGRLGFGADVNQITASFVRTNDLAPLPSDFTLIVY